MNEVNNTCNVNQSNTVLNSNKVVFPVHENAEYSASSLSGTLEDDILSQFQCTNEYVRPSSMGEQFNDTKYLLDFPEVVNIFNNTDDLFHESLFSMSLYPKTDMEHILLNV